MKKLILSILLFLSGCVIKEPVAVAITDDIPDFTVYDGQLNPENYLAYSSEKIAWGIGPAKQENLQPQDCIDAQMKYQNYSSQFLISDQKEILLTFDNGYENGNTSSILDILKKHDVHAIFFITSQYARENADLVQRMIDEGHTIGNHSWHHYSFPELSTENLITEIMSLHNYMIEHFQYNMTAIRPPKGEFSERTLAICKDLGYTTYMWSYAYYDYNVNDQPTEAEAFNKLVTNLHPGEILLLHAVSSTNMNILDEFIDETLNKGYTFVH